MWCAPGFYLGTLAVHTLSKWLSARYQVGGLVLKDIINDPATNHNYVAINKYLSNVLVTPTHLLNQNCRIL